MCKTHLPCKKVILNERSALTPIFYLNFWFLIKLCVSILKICLPKKKSWMRLITGINIHKHAQDYQPISSIKVVFLILAELITIVNKQYNFIFSIILQRRPLFENIFWVCFHNFWLHNTYILLIVVQMQCAQYVFYSLL